MNKAILAILREISSVAGGALAGAFSLVKNTIIDGAKQLMGFHEEGIAFARDMGMSLNQANAYTKALAENTAKLAFQYGVTSETILKVQRSMADATGKQILLNQKQTESFLQFTKLAGESSVAKFQEEMMQGMGAQIDTVEGAIAKAYATSAKSGLSAKKTTEIIANNLGMANKLSFRTGIDGLTRMAVQAQKIGMSLQSVESVAKTFMDFDSAIEHSAQLQMLGGAGGAFGGNPLDMMYEANYDPEALQDRMSKMLGGYAQFDAKTGMSKINGLGMDFVRNIAKAMGMDEGEAVRVAKKNAELKFKQDRFGATFSNRSQEEQDAIMNRSYVKDGRLWVNDAKGEAHDITNGNIDKDLMKELKQFEGMSDRDIMEKQASELTTINERINAFFTSVYAKIATKFADYIPAIQEWITKNGGVLLEKIHSGIDVVATKIPEYWEKIVDFLKEAKSFWDNTKTILKAIGVGVAALVGIWGAKNLFSLLGKTRGAGGALSRAAKPVGNVLKKAGGAVKKGLVGVRDYGRYVKDNYSKLRSGGKNPISSLFKSLKGPKVLSNGTIQNRATGAFMGNVGSNKAKSMLAKSVMKGAKLAKSGGIGIVGALGNMAIDNAVENGSVERGGAFHYGAKMASTAAEYAAIGGMLGPIGAGIGGTVGAIKGAYDTWKSLPENADKNFLDFAKSATNSMIEGVKSFGSGLASAAKKAKEIFDDPIGAAKSGLSWVKGKLGFAEGGAIPGNSYTGDKVNIGVNSGEAIITPKQFNTLFKMTDMILRAKPVGKNDFTYTPGRSETSTVGNHTMTVKDFNININGNLRLDGGGSSTNLDVRQLLNDPSFVNQLKDIIKDSIAADVNGGRRMNDLASMRGLPAQTTTWGRKG